MQKKLIALAVASLASGAAFAQVAPNNVTLYGIVDMGYAYSWDNNSDNAKNKGEVKAGGLDGSRVGVKGEEDLGNGLKASFDATWSFASDVNSPVTLGEGSSVALEGAFGKVKAGYFGDFLDDNTNTDASGRHGAINAGSLYDTGKYENFVAYYSPVFSGFQVKAGFSSNVGGQDNDPTAYAGQKFTAAPNVPVYDADGNQVGTYPVRTLVAAQTLNTRAYTAAASYANGPITAGVAYAQYNLQTTNGYTGGDKKSTDWNAGFKYDFGVVAASVFYGQQKMGDAALPNSKMFGNQFMGVDTKKKMWALGLSAPIGANDTIMGGYAEAKLQDSDGASGKINVFDVVYLHSLSKRSTVYAMYGKLGKDFKDVDSGNYGQYVNVGLRHTF